MSDLNIQKRSDKLLKDIPSIKKEIFFDITSIDEKIFFGLPKNYKKNFFDLLSIKDKTLLDTTYLIKNKKEIAQPKKSYSDVIEVENYLTNQSELINNYIFLTNKLLLIEKYSFESFDAGQYGEIKKIEKTIIDASKLFLKYIFNNLNIISVYPGMNGDITFEQKKHNQQFNLISIFFENGVAKFNLLKFDREANLIKEENFNEIQHLVLSCVK